MYKVSIFNDGHEIEIHNPNVNNLKLETGSIKKEINKIDSFNMSFYQDSPAHGHLKPLKTLIKVMNTKTGIYEFEGRVLSPTGRMTEDGLHTYSYVCEGELSYLHDSQQRHIEFRGTPLELLTLILNYHNEQVEDYKHFEVGIVEVTNSTDNLYVYLSAERSTFEEIEDKILDRIGGELRIRKENDVRYLDILNRVGDDKSTEIRIARNLKSMSQSVDPTEIVTRLTPLGTRVESEDEDATDASEARLTIESVNNGLPYIDREGLIAEFGIKGGSVTWDDITLPNRLLSTGRDWLTNQKVAHVQYEISALDLFLIGLEFDYFDVGNSHPVVNPIMNLDERLRIVGKTTNINNPQDASLKIGDKFKTLNDYQADANKRSRQVIDLQSRVEGQSRTISTIKNEVVTVESNLQDLQKVVEDADIEGLPDAIGDLEDAINSLNDALAEIPVYGPATYETDGLQTAVDKLAYDQLKTKIDLLAVTDQINLDHLKQKLDRLTVTQPINLDQLYQDVEDLKNNQE
ncbi:phage tail spike protein [Amphibacillus sp. Q70]|uniref:phage tail spike protein n=1 Tax=Amphibacillus sp. Q70 TaxID=3453416 RepID=UPI003F856658